MLISHHYRSLMPIQYRRWKCLMSICRPTKRLSLSLTLGSQSGNEEYRCLWIHHQNSHRLLSGACIICVIFFPTKVVFRFKVVNLYIYFSVSNLLYCVICFYLLSHLFCCLFIKNTIQTKNESPVMSLLICLFYLLFNFVHQTQTNVFTKRA